MQQYYIEGLFVPRQSLRKASKAGMLSRQYAEPFARAFWATNQEEALRMATEALDGGRWVDAPRVGQVTEEQRMRALGAPELPGFGAPVARRNKKRAKS